MSEYVDGFVIPIPKERIGDYRRMAETAATIWHEHGALEYHECVGDDLEIKDMPTGFPKIAGAGPDETVIFAWITYHSREHRDEVNAKVMEDPRMKDFMEKENLPFDCKRMAYGGFRSLVKL